MTIEAQEDACVQTALKPFWNNYLERKKLKNELCEVGCGRKVWKESHELLLGLSLSDGLCYDVFALLPHLMTF